MTTDLDRARPGVDLVDRLTNPSPEVAAVDARSSIGTVSDLHVHRSEAENWVGDNTSFDMVVRNRASRYHLVMDALNNGRRTPPGASDLRARRQAKLAQHESYVVEHLEDLPEVRDWVVGDWAEQS